MTDIKAASQQHTNAEEDRIEAFEREAKPTTQIRQNEDIVPKDVLAEAVEAEAREHQMGLWQAAKMYPMACFWAFIMAFTIIMESFDVFLVGNFVALPAFQNAYGITLPNGQKTISTPWQTSLQQAGPIGAVIGVLLAGPLTDRVGYRWAVIIGLIALNGTIFFSFFGRSLVVYEVGQILEGVSWGIFIADSPAYASEVVPIPLRGACTATIQMCWAIGSIIVAIPTYVLSNREDQWAYRIPFALQWMFPTPLIILLFFAPESPWWLVRHGHNERALHSIKRLGRSSNGDDPQNTLAMMQRLVQIEHTTKKPNLIDLFKGTDLRRTIITCLVYAGQNFAGNLIANQATYFFEQAGMSSNFSFALGLITSCLQMVAVMCSWILTAYFGRRTIYLWGTAAEIALLFSLGIAACVPQNHSANYAQACLGVIISFTFALTLGPISYTIIAETSSVRLRPLTTGVGRGAYYVANIPLIWISSELLNPSGWGVAGKCGFVWGGTACICFVLAYFCLPEMKHRSYRELDILFHRRVSARKFRSTEVDATENE